MRWIPVLFALAVAALTFMGVTSPQWAFTLLPFLAAVIFAWVLVAGAKEFMQSGALHLTRGNSASPLLQADPATASKGGSDLRGSSTGNRPAESDGGFSAVA